MKRFILTSLLFWTAFTARANTELPLDAAKTIKTYSIVRYNTELPKIAIGDIIKIQFIRRSSQISEYEGDCFNSAVYGAAYSESARVRVPNTARAWYMKIPQYGVPRNMRIYGVYAKVLDDGNGKRLEMLGNTIENSFAKAVIKWSGQE